jgi:hypothetical protein
MSNHTKKFKDAAISHGHQVHDIVEKQAQSKRAIFDNADAVATNLTAHGNVDQTQSGMETALSAGGGGGGGGGNNNDLADAAQQHISNAAQWTQDNATQENAQRLLDEGKRMGQEGYEFARANVTEENARRALEEGKRLGQQGFEEGKNIVNQGLNSDIGQQAQSYAAQGFQEGKNIVNQGLNSDEFAQGQAMAASAANAARGYANQAYNSDIGQQGQAIAADAVRNGQNLANQAYHSDLGQQAQGMAQSAAHAARNADYQGMANEAKNIGGQGLDAAREYGGQAASVAQDIGGQGIDAARNYGGQAANAVRNADYQGMANDAKDLGGQGIAAARQYGGQAANAAANAARNVDYQGIANDAKDLGGQGLNAARDGAQQVANSDEAKQALAYGRQGVAAARDGAQQVANSDEAKQALAYGQQGVAAAGNVIGRGANAAANSAAGQAVIGGVNDIVNSEQVQTVLNSDEVKFIETQLKENPALVALAPVAIPAAALYGASLAIKKVPFDQASEFVRPGVDVILPALMAASGLLNKGFDLIKLEIFRDFFQVLALFFEGLRVLMPESFKEVWQKISSLFSFCFSCWFEDFLADNETALSIALLVIETLIAVPISLIFIKYYRDSISKDVAIGLDKKTWAARGSTIAFRVKVACLILTTMYLPVALNSIQAAACDLKYIGIREECSSNSTYIFLLTLALINLVFFLIPIPYVFFKIIQMEKPKVSLYDAEGKLKKGDTAYTDADYRKDLDKDTSPFRILYDGYERRWAFYKVIVMMIKVLIVLPAALFVPTSVVGGRDTEERRDLLTVQVVCLFLVMLSFAVTAWCSRPYLKDADDMLDAVSRGTCTFVALSAVILLADDSSEEGFGIGLNLVTTLAALFMISIFLSSVGFIRTKCKNWVGRVDFSMSRLDTNLAMVFSGELDLRVERKLRIWHEFWDVLFSQDPKLQIPNKNLELKYQESTTVGRNNKIHPESELTKKEQEELEEAKKKPYKPVTLNYAFGGSPPYLLDFKGTVQERHEENKKIVSHESFPSYERSLFLFSNINRANALDLQRKMQTLMVNLTGLDVYWDGMLDKPAEGDQGAVKTRAMLPNQTKTKFGKLYITPFPFCATVVMDEDDSFINISLSPVVDGMRRNIGKGMMEFQNLIVKNLDPEITRRKSIRMSLRALSGSDVYFYHQEICRVRVKNDDDAMRYKSVEVNLTFKKGKFNVQQKGTAKWAHPTTGNEMHVGHGFECSLSYTDGTGVTTDGHQVTGHKLTIGANQLGIERDYKWTDKLQKLLGVHTQCNQYERSNNQHVQSNFAVLNANFSAYRQHYYEEFRSKEHTLSYAFWYYVYNNPWLNQKTLTTVLTQFERNPLVNAIPTTHKKDLEVLYGKLRYFDSHPAIAYWFTFWHDLHAQNKDIKAFNTPEAKKLLDPYDPGSLCYVPVKRDVLEVKLDKAGLRTSTLCCYKGLINDRILNQLFENLAKSGGIEFRRGVEGGDQQLLSKVIDNYKVGADFFQTEAKGRPQFTEIKIREGKHGGQRVEIRTNQVQTQGVNKNIVIQAQAPTQQHVNNSGVNMSNMQRAMGMPQQRAFPQMQQPQVQQQQQQQQQQQRPFVQPHMQQQRVTTQMQQPRVQQQQQHQQQRSFVQPHMQQQRVTTQMQQPRVQANAALPPGWTSAVDPKSGRTYYRNHQNNTTSWTRPAPLQQQQPRPNPMINVVGGSPANSPLPTGWRQAVDPRSGRTYYANVATKQTTWTRPTR